MLRCHTCARSVTVSRRKTAFGGSLGGRKSIQIGGVRFVEKNVIGGRPNRRKCSPGQGLQSACGTSGPMWESDKCAEVTGESTRGWSPIQSIVTNLREESRKGLTDGLREFIKIDHHRALEERHLKEGLGTFKIRRPKGQQGCPEVAATENPVQLTLRAEVVGTRKSYINVGEVGSSPGTC